jgi:hypothetical protein
MNAVYLDDEGNVAGVSGNTTPKNWRESMESLQDVLEVIR